MTLNCYNTCFALARDDAYILVDGGGGNGILKNLKKANVPVDKIHHVFVTHSHSDHILGIVWVVRKAAMLMSGGRYEDNLNIYGHDEVIRDIMALLNVTMEPRVLQLIGVRIMLQPVTDGQTMDLAGHEFTFFDIYSTKAKQFGFTTRLGDGQTLACLGDEPFNSRCRPYVEDSDWLLCEAFCLYGDREIYRPYEIHHSTVKDACELARQLHVKNLVLWHTEEENLSRRRELYTREGRQYYDGNLYVPDDLDVLILDEAGQ